MAVSIPAQEDSLFPRDVPLLSFPSINPMPVSSDADEAQCSDAVYDQMQFRGHVDITEATA